MGDHPADRFAAEWLALREPADARARSSAILARMLQWAARHPRIRVLDLGCGTGANLRCLCPRLPVEQHWTCVDHDPDVIAELRRRGSGCKQAVELNARVLPIDAEAALEALAPDTLVTASALLDLVSEPWLDWLLTRCREHLCPVLFALTYDGRAALDPPHPDDRLVIALVNAHQRRDKSLGPALGPTAAARLAAIGDRLGYRVHSDASDWDLGPDEAALSAALIGGWLGAAREQAPERSVQLENWHASRRGAAARGELRIRVGHRDILLDT